MPGIYDRSVLYVIYYLWLGVRENGNPFRKTVKFGPPQPALMERLSRWFWKKSLRLSPAMLLGIVIYWLLLSHLRWFGIDK